MGVAADLGYVHRPPGPVRRTMQLIAGTRFGSWFFSKTIEPMDRLCRKLTKGRASLPELLAGLPVIFVTTQGRKSGQPRTHPLAGVPHGDALALIGSNFGGTRTPGWAFNLEVNPSAHVEYRDVGVDVTARPATEEERLSIWKAAASIYPGYENYRRRIRGREVRIFVLESNVRHLLH